MAVQRRQAVLSNNALTPSTTRANRGLKKLPTQLANRPPQSTSTNLPPSSLPLSLHPVAPRLLLTPNPQSLPSHQFQTSPPTYPLHHYSTRPQLPFTSAAAWTKPHHPATPLLLTARDWEKYHRDSGPGPSITRRLNDLTPRLP